MSKWMFAALLGLQAHFAASYLVPLDPPGQRAFGGLLRWAWPWAHGDSGPLGVITPAGFPAGGFFIAVTAAVLLGMAAMAVLGWWVPTGWWRNLALVGSALTVVLFALFLGPTKVLPILTAVAIAAAATGHWIPQPR